MGDGAAPRERNQGKSHPSIAPISVFGLGIGCGMTITVKPRSTAHLATHCAIRFRYSSTRAQKWDKSHPPIVPISVFGGGVRCATMTTTVKPRSAVHLAVRRAALFTLRENGGNSTLHKPPISFFGRGVFFQPCIRQIHFQTVHGFRGGRSYGVVAVESYPVCLGNPPPQEKSQICPIKSRIYPRRDLEKKRKLHPHIALEPA